jgi:type IX secretion system PorP/SprF family membrane protein
VKNLVFHIVVFFCFLQIGYSQEGDGVVALDLPIRNSLTFNRYVVNPTFSFVREQNKYITATNKREMMGIDDAPNTYLFSYSGRIQENMGVGIGVFQQNYGVLTTFGGILNYAYNARIQEDSNFTFGINIGAYRSGLNSGSVVTNIDDPALNNIPSNFLLTANPAVNYGTGFMDFGISYNNLVCYNSSTSELVKENPKRGLQGHIMYTGYFGGYGFFGDSKFSALARSEFQKETTIISGSIILTVPKGIWAQASYNSKYGLSGGLGVNITAQIAIEYNYEKSLGGLSDFGPSHEITLAYRFKNNNYYDYSRDDELAGLLSFEKKEKKTAKAPVSNKVEEVEKVDTEEVARKAAEALAIVQAEEHTRLAEEEENRLAIEEQTRVAEEEQAREAAEELSKIQAEEQARLAAEEETRLAIEEQTRLAEEKQAREAAEALAIIQAEDQAKLAAEEKTRLAEEEQTRLIEEEKARIVAEELAIIQAEEQTRLAVEEQEKLEAEKIANEQLIKNPTDNIGKSISELTVETDRENEIQTQLLNELEIAVSIKKKDLKDLKEENDLSDQNIYVAPKPFKSITKENEEIELLKIQLDTILIRQNKKIERLESLLVERLQTYNNPDDETNQYYLNSIAILKTEQYKAKRKRESLVSTLEEISIATLYERKRRIKRAAYDNDQDRYTQDRRTLNILKQNTSLSNTELAIEDLDFGRERNSNIQILKNVQNVESGYYLVLAVHSNVEKRDKFLTQVISSGYNEVDFFFDVNTSEYYIYSKKFNNINETERALISKQDEPYNENINIIKIEN